ncbi:MAG: ATP-binding protein [Planctomycetota bacterium]
MLRDVRHVLLRSRERRLWPGLLVGGGAMAFAVMAGQLLASTGSGDRFYVLLVLPVIVAAWLSGVTAGMLVAVTGAVALELLNPRGGLTDFAAVFDYLPTLAFVVSGLIMSLLAARARTAALSAERDRQDLGQQHATVLEQIDECVIVADAQGEPVSLNAAARRFYGPELGPMMVPTEAGTARSFDGTPIPPEQLPMARALAGDRVSGERYELTPPGGEPCKIEAGASPLADEDGHTIGVVLSFRDITADLQRQAVLTEKQAFLQAVLDTVDEAIVTCDTAGELTLFNRAAEDLLGPLQRVGHGAWQDTYGVFSLDSDRRLDENDYPLLRALRGETVKNAPLRFRQPDAPERIVAWSGRQYSDDDGVVRGAVVSGRDLTQIIGQRLKLERTLDDLRRSNEELQHFAYVASHDLQEPLRKIRAFGDRLAARLDKSDDATALDFLSRMQGAARRMSTLISDLLSFSRVTSDVNPPVPTDLAQVAAEVVDDLRPAIDEAGARVTIQPGLPTIDSEPTRMRQLFQNLLSNALKFRRPDTPALIDVTWAWDENGTMLELRFADNGIGIDHRHRDKVFAIFQRLHGRHRYEGTGIGLAVVRKIVERHDGTVRIESEPGVGTTFIVRLAPSRARPEPAAVD